MTCRGKIGSLNDDACNPSPAAQVARSTYADPVTDLRFRKVVQYVSFPSVSGVYEYDYADGHGTHVAGTVAGRLARDEAYNDAVAELEACGNQYDAYEYDNDSCADYASVCASYFCPTCDYAGYCDEVRRVSLWRAPGWGVGVRMPRWRLRGQAG